MNGNSTNDQSLALSPRDVYKLKKLLSGSPAPASGDSGAGSEEASLDAVEFKLLLREAVIELVNDPDVIEAIAQAVAEYKANGNAGKGRKGSEQTSRSDQGSGIRFRHI